MNAEYRRPGRTFKGYYRGLAITEGYGSEVEAVRVAVTKVQNIGHTGRVLSWALQQVTVKEVKQDAVERDATGNRVRS